MENRIIIDKIIRILTDTLVIRLYIDTNTSINNNTNSNSTTTVWS